jgi:hypothetical protein
VQPSEIEHPIDARKDMVVRDQVPQRAADEELQLPPHPSPQHPPPLAEPQPDEENQDAGTFSTAPATALMGGVENPPRRRAQPLVVVGNHQPDAAQPATGEAAEEVGPEGFGLGRAGGDA